VPVIEVSFSFNLKVYVLKGLIFGSTALMTFISITWAAQKFSTFYGCDNWLQELVSAKFQSTDH
jgi:hypothetical protein